MGTLQTFQSEKHAVGNTGRSILGLGVRHGAPIVLSVLLWWLLWFGHAPSVATTDEAMKHVSWIGIVALVYLAWQAQAILVQPRGGVMHTLVEILVSLLPLFVVGYAVIDWLRDGNPLSVFQVIVMTQAALATLIDVVIFTWFSLRLNRLTMAHAVGGN